MNTNKVSVGIIAAVLFGMMAFTSGCVSIPTPSGHAEVTVQLVDKEYIKNIVVDEFLNKGYEVDSQTDYSIMLCQRSNALGIKNKLSISVNIVVLENVTRIVAIVRMEGRGWFNENIDGTSNFNTTIEKQLIIPILNKIKTRIETPHENK